jgi:zinc protease
MTKSTAKSTATKSTATARTAARRTPKAGAPTRNTLPAWVRSRKRPSKTRAKWLGSESFGATLTLHRFVLRNGLQVIVLPDSSAPVVSYHTWFRVGSRHERRGKTGISHLFEHLMFKATKNRGPGEFDRSLESLGGETNASTWTDWTQYHENVPRKAVSLVVELESDRMAHLVLSKEQVASEKEVVANERRQRVDDDVDGTASEVLYQLAYQKHPYRIPTIGFMRDIQGFTVKDCMAFYRTYYAPNNATVVCVGDVNGDDLLRRIEKHYGPYKKARIPKESSAREPIQRRARRKALRLPTPTERVTVAVHAPAFGTYDHAVLTVAHEIVLGGRASRLYDRLVVKEQRVTDVGGFLAPFRDPGLWEISAHARPGAKLSTIERALVEEIERLGREPVSTQELERAKNRLELSFLGGMETAAGKAEQIGFYETVMGNPVGAFTRLAEYQRVTASDIQRVVSDVFAPQHRTTLTVHPKRGHR